MDKDLINKQLTARYKRLNKLTESIEKKLLILPEGKIRILRKHNTDYYYYVDKDRNLSRRSYFQMINTLSSGWTLPIFTRDSVRVILTMKL